MAIERYVTIPDERFMVGPKSLGVVAISNNNPAVHTEHGDSSFVCCPKFLSRLGLYEQAIVQGELSIGKLSLAWWEEETRCRTGATRCLLWEYRESKNNDDSTPDDFATVDIGYIVLSTSFGNVLFLSRSRTSTVLPLENKLGWQRSR